LGYAGVFYFKWRGAYRNCLWVRNTAKINNEVSGKMTGKHAFVPLKKFTDLTNAKLIVIFSDAVKLRKF